MFAYYSPMGGDQSSTTRQREAGKICCSCKSWLPTPHVLGERYCTRCKPPLRPIYVAFEQKKGWEVIVYDRASQQRIRTLQFQDEGKLLEMVRRGGGLANLEAKQSIERAISDGKGGVFLRLTPEQFAKLKIR